MGGKRRCSGAGGCLSQSVAVVLEEGTCPYTPSKGESLHFHGCVSGGHLSCKDLLLNDLSRLVQLICLFCLVFSRAMTAEEPITIAGRWDITIQFVHGDGNYTAFLEQTGEKLHGTYRGQFTEGTLDGTVHGKNIRFRGHLKIEGTDLIYIYKGTVEGDQMRGEVDLDEYGEARWVARKH
jgi:hypothetical protein